MDNIRIKRFTTFLIAGWILSMLMLLTLRIYHSRKYLKKQEEIISTIAYHKDIMYRLWVSEHGGVYVRTSDKMRPNPYLEVKNRDIVTKYGDTLTLINPAYMTRQVLELSAQRFDLPGRLISLKPVNPINTPDDWERKVLESFEKGDTVAIKTDIINQKTYKRFVKPFVTEKSCLSCHASQGYKVGDIRGGISIYVPVDELNKAMINQNLSLIVFYVIIIALGMVIIVFLMQKLKKQIESKQEIEKELIKRQQLIEIQNRDLKKHISDKDKFFKILAHDLRNQFFVILGFSDLLLEHNKTFTTEKREKHLELLNRTAHDTYKFMEDLLVWANSQSGKIPFQQKEIELQQFFIEQTKNLKNMADNKNIGFDLICNTEVVVYADYNMLVDISD